MSLLCLCIPQILREEGLHNIDIQVEVYIVAVDIEVEAVEVGSQQLYRS